MGKLALHSLPDLASEQLQAVLPLPAARQWLGRQSCGQRSSVPKRQSGSMALSHGQHGHMGSIHEFYANSR